MATLRATEETRLVYESPSDEGGRQSRKDVREALAQAHRIPLPRKFSRSEQERARACDRDPRIFDALAHAGEYGVAEYLAAGPEMVHDWENAWSPNTDPRAPSHPRGAALVAAGVDIRRGGYTSRLPRRLLEDVHDHYLRERGGARLRPEPLADAWAWATRPRRATTALLQDVDDQQVEVFDYLLDTVQHRSRASDHVPDTVLQAALAACAPVDADNIAEVAYYHGRYHLAETGWLTAYHTRTKDLGPEHLDTLASRQSHANMLRDLGRFTEAEREHQIIADIGARVYGPEHPVVLRSRAGRAFVLVRLNQLEEAEEELRTVCDISSRVLGPEHDITLTSRHVRAIALHHLDRLTEAKAENRPFSMPGLALMVLRIWAHCSAGGISPMSCTTRVSLRKRRERRALCWKSVPVSSARNTATRC